MQPKKVGEKDPPPHPRYLPEKTNFRFYINIHVYVYTYHILILSRNYLATVQHLLYIKRIMFLYYTKCTVYVYTNKYDH